MASPLNYRPMYSSIIKMARFFVLLQSWREWEAQVSGGVTAGMEGLGSGSGVKREQQEKRIRQEVEERRPSIFSMVRGKVRRFI